ncbi:MAG: hypothetical protein AAB417_00205 [Patescibacteria group bacterium]
MQDFSSKQWLYGVSVLFGVCILLFVVTELFFRFFLPQTLNPFVYDPIIGMRQRPGTFVAVTDGEVHYKHVNSAGFVDEERTKEKPSGTKRIVVLGNSFSQANQVDDDKDFASVLQAKLQSEGYSYEVLNFGIRGMSVTQQYLTLREYALAYHPDIVIFATSFFNDVADNVPQLGTPVHPFIVFENGTERFISPHNPAQGFPWSFLRNHFHVYRWAVQKYFLVKSNIKNLAARDAEHAAVTREETPLVFFETYSEKAQARSEWQEAWRISEEMLRRSKKLSEEAGANFVLFMIPNRVEIYSDDWKNLLDQSAQKFPQLKNESYNLTLPYQQASRIGENIGTLPIDPHDVFLHRAEQGERLYMPIDHHFSVRGHETVAEVLLAAFKERGLLTK